MTLERRAWVVARILTVILVLVSLRIIYWQMIRGEELQPVAASSIEDIDRLPQPVVQRTIDLLRTIRRGSIYDRNGRLLAADIAASNGGPVRFYSEPSLAHAIGYVSGLRIGVTGLELTYNNTLLGLDRPDAQLERMLNRPVVGSDLILTVDSYVQRAAEKALNGRPGAVVVLDAQSGAILAMTSAPRFDPNRVLDSGYKAELMDACGGKTNCQAPFLNRATQALYSPGSTWKTVALIAALDTGQVKPDTLFDFGQPIQGSDGSSYYAYQVDGGIIPDPNHTQSQLNLEMSYATSANAAFARIGDEMPADTLLRYAARFGFGAPGEISFPLEIETTPAQLARDPHSLYENNLLRASTAIGQGELLSSPLNIGMVVLSVLNDGNLPLPYFVQSVKGPDGSEVERPPNRHVLRNLMKAETAQQVRQMMLRVVTDGTGQKAQIPGALVGGKTGTAQLGGDLEPHSWFAGFAQNENHAVVVVVLIENGGEGSQTAAPVFAEVAKAALAHLGEPVEEIVPPPASAPIAPGMSTQAAP